MAHDTLVRPSVDGPPSFAHQVAHVPMVLVVDDEPISRKIVHAKMLTFGANVIEAADGAAAFAELRNRRFDLAIVDLDMPTMDGMDLIRCVRGHPQLNHIPIVVLTGNESRGSLDGALSAGATSFLRKPLNWRCFGPHIRHLLQIARPPLLQFPSAFAGMPTRKGSIGHDS